MIRSTRFSVALMPVLKSMGCSSLQVSLRFKEAGYRRYSSLAKEMNNLNITDTGIGTFWLVAFSPGGIIPLPFPICLGFPDGLVLACYLLARGKH